ncbi:MAG TPA: hypothetical protein VGS05_11195 [Candidatus Sulfotelmatobacter sp.]|nr:hypothetical protein [Candidatus Sulfotelmatobacter sp.]
MNTLTGMIPGGKRSILEQPGQGAGEDAWLDSRRDAAAMVYKSRYDRVAAAPKYGAAGQPMAAVPT